MSAAKKRLTPYENFLAGNPLGVIFLPDNVSLGDHLSVLDNVSQHLSQDEILERLKRQAEFSKKKKRLANDGMGVLFNSSPESYFAKLAREQIKERIGVDKHPVDREDNSEIKPQPSDRANAQDSVGDPGVVNVNNLPDPPFPQPSEPDVSKLNEEQRLQLGQLGKRMEVFLSNPSYDPLDQECSDAYMELLYEYPKEVRRVFMKMKIQENLGKG